MNIFELLGNAAISIEDPDELSIAERHALNHVLKSLKDKNVEVLGADRRRERRFHLHPRREFQD
jgi:hypothetical protein